MGWRASSHCCFTFSFLKMGWKASSHCCFSFCCCCFSLMGHSAKPTGCFRLSKHRDWINCDCRLFLSLLHVNCCHGTSLGVTGMAVVLENANFRGIETDFPRRKTTVRGEKKSPVQKEKGEKRKKKKGSTGFSSALNTRETYGTRSHAAIARLGRVIVNTVTRCESRGLATGLNAVILTRSALCFG